MKKKKFVIILLCVVLSFALIGFTGCGGEDSGSTGDSGEVSKDQYQTYRVTLFFANEEYMDTGDESLEKYMVYETEISSKPGGAYLDALELLKTSPEEGYGTAISGNIKFNDAYMDGDTVFVDIDSSGLNGGSTEETFLIGQIVNTMINTFAEVKQVQFLVDGETAETLMGHVGTSEPFTKDLFSE